MKKNDNLPPWLQDAPRVKRKSTWRIYIAIIGAWVATVIGFAILGAFQASGGMPSLGFFEALLMFTPIFGSLLLFAWGYYDALGRGKPGILGGILAFLLFPLGLIIWLLIRPARM